MSQLTITPDIDSIVRSKRKFLYVGLGLLLINLYFIYRYIQLGVGSEPQGHYLLVMTFLNFPVFILSIILMLVPLMYKKSFASKKYVFTESGLSVGNINIESLKIKFVEMTEFIPGFYKVQIWYSEEGHHYQLEGVSSPDIMKLKNWCGSHAITIE